MLLDEEGGIDEAIERPPARRHHREGPADRRFVGSVDLDRDGGGWWRMARERRRQVHDSDVVAFGERSGDETAADTAAASEDAEPALAHGSLTGTDRQARSRTGSTSDP